MINLLQKKMDYHEEKLIRIIQLMKSNKEEDKIFLDPDQNLMEAIGTHYLVYFNFF